MLFLERFGRIGQQLNSIKSGIQALIAKNPALAHVKPRTLVPA